MRWDFHIVRSTGSNLYFRPLPERSLFFLWSKLYRRASSVYMARLHGCGAQRWIRPPPQPRSKVSPFAPAIHRSVCGDCCGGFVPSSPIQLYRFFGLTPQDAKNIEKTPTPDSALITRRSGVRIPPPLPRNEAPGVVRTSGALYFLAVKNRLRELKRVTPLALLPPL
jgi:hypothetical protein